jgi:antitoxin component of MazEF toxin-antitoxin module
MANPRGNESTLKKYQPTWKTGRTQTIRVPVALADQILEYARQLDAGNDTQQTGSNHLSQVVELLEDVRDHAPRNSFGQIWRGKVAQAIDLLRSQQPPCG